MFSLVDRLSQSNVDLLPILAPTSVSKIEQRIISEDPVAMAVYVVLLVVCSLIWEELAFQGSLLPSVTIYLPIWGSILASSVAFALVHLIFLRLVILLPSKW